MTPAPLPLPPAPTRAAGTTGPAPAHDWARVYLTLLDGPQFYACTKPQARACNSWTRHHHQCATYYRQAPGGLVLSLTPTQTWRVRSTPQTGVDTL